MKNFCLCVGEMCCTIISSNHFFSSLWSSFSQTSFGGMVTFAQEFTISARRVAESCKNRINNYGIKIYYQDICPRTLSVPRGKQFPGTKLKENCFLLGKINYVQGKVRAYFCTYCVYYHSNILATVGILSKLGIFCHMVRSDHSCVRENIGCFCQSINWS